MCKCSMKNETTYLSEFAHRCPLSILRFALFPSCLHAQSFELITLRLREFLGVRCKTSTKFFFTLSSCCLMAQRLQLIAFRLVRLNTQPPLCQIKPE